MTSSRSAFIYTSFTFLVFVLLIPVIAYAIPGINEPIVPCGIGDDECTFCDGYELVSNVITFLLFIMTFIAIASVAVGGLLIVAGGSKESWRTHGKDAVRYAIIGIVIALAAWLIINTIMVTLADPDAFPVPWNDFPSCDGSSSSVNTTSIPGSSMGGITTGSGLSPETPNVTQASGIVASLETSLNQIQSHPSAVGDTLVQDFVGAALTILDTFRVDLARGIQPSSQDISSFQAILDGLVFRLAADPRAGELAPTIQTINADLARLAGNETSPTDGVTTQPGGQNQGTSGMLTTPQIVQLRNAFREIDEQFSTTIDALGTSAGSVEVIRWEQLFQLRARLADGNDITEAQVRNLQDDLVQALDNPFLEPSERNMINSIIRQIDLDVLPVFRQ